MFTETQPQSLISFLMSIEQRPESSTTKIVSIRVEGDGFRPASRRAVGDLDPCVIGRRRTRARRASGGR
jgi:hypothetical protein